MLMLTFLSCIHIYNVSYFHNLSLLCEYLYPMNKSPQHIFYLSNSPVGLTMTRVTYRLQLIIYNIKEFTSKDWEITSG